VIADEAVERDRFGVMTLSGIPFAGGEDHEEEDARQVCVEASTDWAVGQQGAARTTGAMR